MVNNHLYFGNDIDTKNLNVVYLSMGCFWRPEELFWKLNGVKYTEVGYAECETMTPSCSDAFSDVAHKETVKVYYNNNEIALSELLSVFFNNHTIDLRDDFPVPSLYRSRVYFEDKSDFNIYKDVLNKTLRERKENGNEYPVATKVKIISNYIKADEHHQQYNLRNK